MARGASTHGRKPLVVYWNNQPTPYVVDRFNAVVRHADFDFEAWFDTVREDDRSWDVNAEDWQFTATMVQPSRAPGVLARVPLQLLRNRRPDLLITNYDRLHMLLGLAAAKPYTHRTALRCLPSWPAWEQPSRLRTVGKHVAFRMADAAKVPGNDGRRYAEHFGMPADRIHTVTQSADVESFAAGSLMLADARMSLRRQLGATGCAFLYAGRMWRGKGVHDLIHAYDRVVHDSRILNDPGAVSLLLAGDGEDEPFLRELAKDLPNVRWLGFIQPRDLPALYGASDVFVFPTLGDPNGLVVDEAMAACLPVISSTSAGDIRTRIRDGVDGYIVDTGDIGGFADAMVRLALDQPLRRRVGSAAQLVAADKTPERYAQDFCIFARSVLTARARHHPFAHDKR